MSKKASNEPENRFSNSCCRQSKKRKIFIRESTLTLEEMMEDFLTFDFFPFSTSLSPEVERILEFLRLSTLELRVLGLLFGIVGLLAGF